MTDTSLVNRELSWLEFNRARPRGSPGPQRAAAGAGEVPRHLQLEPGRVLHGPRGRAQAGAFAPARPAPGPDGATPAETLQAIARRIHELVDRAASLLPRGDPAPPRRRGRRHRPAQGGDAEAARVPRGVLPADAPSHPHPARHRPRPPLPAPRQPVPLPRGLGPRHRRVTAPQGDPWPSCTSRPTWCRASWRSPPRRTCTPSCSSRTCCGCTCPGSSTATRWRAAMPSG